MVPVFLIGCTDPLPKQTTTPDPNAEVLELIGGFQANDKRLDGIGSMVASYPPSPYYNPPPIQICSAALIGPETVLTAKHCVDIIPLAIQLGFTVQYAIGPNASAPRRMAEVVAYEMAPGDEGGFVGMGRDVGIMHLDTPITDEPMLTVGALSDADLGAAFAAIGYGVQDNTYKAGTRRLGKQTLRAREGKVFEILFGSFERFWEWWQTGVVTPEQLAAVLPAGSIPAASDGGAPTDASRPDGGVDVGPPVDWEKEYARRIYETTVLEKEYEVVTGGAPGDAQVCYGDSGSPLVKRIDGQYVAFGVVSGGIGSRDLVCDLGAVYASFGPETMAFIEKAQAWVDPCGELTSAGTCDGDVAKRCTNIVEGRRRLVEFDCSSLGLTCGVSNGQVACDDLVIAPPARPEPPRGAAAPNFRHLVDRVFRNAFLRK